MKMFQNICLLLLMTMTSSIFAQKVDTPITITEEGIFNKKVYTKCDIELTKPQLMTLIAKDPQLSQFKGGVIFHYTMSALLNAAGTILISYPLYQELDNNHDNTNWTLGYIGLGCIAASIPFNIAFNNKAKKAVDYYNAGYQNPTSYNFKLQLSGNSLGLALNF